MSFGENNSSNWEVVSVRGQEDGKYKVDRLPVPGGWLYAVRWGIISEPSITFVPFHSETPSS